MYIDQTRDKEPRSLAEKLALRPLNVKVLNDDALLATSFPFSCIKGQNLSRRFASRIRLFVTKGSVGREARALAHARPQGHAEKGVGKKSTRQGGERLTLV